MDQLLLKTLCESIQYGELDAVIRRHACYAQLRDTSRPQPLPYASRGTVPIVKKATVAIDAWIHPFREDALNQPLSSSTARHTPCSMP